MPTFSQLWADTCDACGRGISIVNETARRQNLKYRLRVLSVGPPLVGGLIFLLLAFVPQMREVYLGLIEDFDVMRGVAGLGLLTLVCAMIYVWHFWVGTAAINRTYPDHADIHLDSSLMNMSNRKALICAALPFAGLIFGLWGLQTEVSLGSNLLDAISKHFLDTTGASLSADLHWTKSSLSRAPFLIAIVICLTLIALVVMHRYLPRADDAGGKRFRWSIAGTSVALSLLVSALPLFWPSLLVPLARVIGPLAMIMLALLAAVTALSIISVLIKNIDASIIKGLIVVVAAWFVTWYGISSLRYGPFKALQAPLVSTETADDKAARKAFRDWLRARADRNSYGSASASRGYPVLLIAAQGGGIYATAASAAFLSGMQDRCANFAQHVFAISGVSGGAVGTSVFSGLVHDLKQSAGACTSRAVEPLPPERQTVSRRADAIVLDDHLSPLIGALASDVASLGFATEIDRARALERSFACSFDAYRTMSPLAGSSHLATQVPLSCAETHKSGLGLRADYDEFWKPTGAAPIPMLNAVWTEVGYRIAFAPFKLAAVGDGTLLGLHDLPLADNAARHTLIEAALTSARFPVFAPPRVLPANVPGGDRQLWSFVDGGYVDNSGAATALDLYKLLETEAVAAEREDGIKVDLRLVLLTEAEAKLDYRKITATGLADIVGPVEALLNVRRQLSQRAVAQAVEYVSKRRNLGLSALTLTRKDNRAVMTVDLDQQTFKLPLGWKISTVTNDIVRLMMGRPDLCPADKPTTTAGSPLEAILGAIERNSCVQYRLVQLLQAEK